MLAPGRAASAVIATDATSNELFSGTYMAGAIDGLAALFGGRAPGGLAALAFELLVDHRAVGRITLDRILRDGAVGADAELLGQLGAAAIVLEDDSAPA